MSKGIGTLRRRRPFTLLVAMIAVLAVVGISLSQTPDALAATLTAVHCTYYSDSSHTVPVGEVYYTCNHTSVLYGTATSYKVCDDYDYCCGTSWC